MATETPQYSSFNPGYGFTVTNNTSQNVYLQKPNVKFDTIVAGDTSTNQMDYGTYTVRNNNNINASVYLTVKVDEGNGSVAINSGTQKGAFVVTSTFV